MKFNAWSKKRIRNGTKILTSRKARYCSDPAVYCSFGPFPWWFIKRFLYRDEGAESPEELQRIINQIFRRTVQDHELFYVHVLNPDLEV
jgi:hypothetical protein